VPGLRRDRQDGGVPGTVVKAEHVAGLLMLALLLWVLTAVVT
jgi:hypothetical protein